MRIEPDKLIESQGYIYKLVLSKEEVQERDERVEKERLRNLGAFKSMIGTEQYQRLQNDLAVLEVRSGGNYPTTRYYDFSDETTWVSDEYSDGDKKSFGDGEYFRTTYENKLEAQSYVSSPLHKAIQDYWYKKLIAIEKLS